MYPQYVKFEDFESYIQEEIQELLLDTDHCVLAPLEGETVHLKVLHTEYDFENPDHDCQVTFEYANHWFQADLYRAGSAWDWELTGIYEVDEYEKTEVRVIKKP